MAVNMDTAHYFSISELFSKLCQRTCDNDLSGKVCGKVAPYIDIFTCSRRCVKCATRYYTSIEGLRGIREFDEAWVARLPSFRVFHKADIPYTLVHGQICTRLYDLTMAAALLTQFSLDMVRARVCARLTVMIAPFLDSKSMRTFGVISCYHCTPKLYEKICIWLHTIPSQDVDYMCIDEYPAHLKEVHGRDYAT